MNAEEALAEVHHHFCAKDGTHDDACVAFSEVLLRAESAERAVWSGLVLADRADARVDVGRRLITTAALRAALLTSKRPESCIAPPGSLCVDTGCWDAGRCIARRSVIEMTGDPVAHQGEQ